MSNFEKKVSETSKKVTEKLTDSGQIMEGGWLAYRKVILPEHVSEIQLSETRQAFFAGAQHLFGSIMTVMDPEGEPTDQDMRRMESIATELAKFYVEMQRMHPIQDNQKRKGEPQ